MLPGTVLQRFGADNFPGFPIVKSMKSTIRTASASAQVVDMPAGIVAGDLLLAVIGVFGITSVSAGWTALDTTTAQYRVAAGGDTLSVTPSGSYTLTAVVYCISGYVGVPTSLSTSVTSATHDPPAVTPAWGLKNTLWILQAGTPNNAGSGFLTFPLNYAASYYLKPGATSNSSLTVWTARRKLRATVEDPGPLTSGVSISCRARTIAVQGTA